MMKIFAIGDVQGCFDELESLLELMKFRHGVDKLWFTGDLVNRGPKSLEVLRFVKSLGDNAVTVLGNHDLHLLAVANGHGCQLAGDTLSTILEASDRDELLHWLRFRPLCHFDADLNCLLIHAGLPPQWNAVKTVDYAREVELVLQGDQYVEFFGKMYGDLPNHWCDSMTGWDRYRYITNAITRLRYLDVNDEFCLSAKGPIGTQPHDCLPWFEATHRLSRNTTIVFGHWSTLGLYNQDNVIGLDSGCLWGGTLTAVELTDTKQGFNKIFEVDCKGERRPKAL